MINKELKSLGLGLNEISVYLSLLKIGKTSVGDIINDTHLHRQSVYNALNLLEGKKLISKTSINKVNHYKLENPDILLVELRKQEKVAKSLSEKVKAELKKTSREQEINVYSGREKIRKFSLNRTKNMRIGSSLYVISNYAQKYIDIVGKDNLVKQDKLCLKRKIKTMIIAGESSRKDFEESKNFLKGFTSYRGRIIKFLPNYLISPIAMEISEETMVFSSLEDEWFMVEIKNKAYYNSYRKYFKGLWKIAKPE